MKQSNEEKWQEKYFDASCALYSIIMEMQSYLQNEDIAALLEEHLNVPDVLEAYEDLGLS